MNKKVLLAMSGGIDSSVSGILLSRQGYDMYGITYITSEFEQDSYIKDQTDCCAVDSIKEAKQMAEKLGYPHKFLDLRNSFKKKIINNFIEEYLRGRTPNPCVVCNSKIKWGELLECADALGCYYIATGHYAQINFQHGRYFLAKGVDDTKDQTYFLYGLNQKSLSRTLFPLGTYKKPEIRKIAAESGFVNLSNKKESQEICFIPDNDYRRFLKEEAPRQLNKIGKGDFVLSNGNKVGTHEGYPFYTIGQRKGLGVAMGYPVYVVDIDIQKNRVILGKKEELNATTFIVGKVNLMKYEHLPENGLEVTVKVRYRNKGVMGIIMPKGDKIEVRLFHSASAVTLGQSAVFYEEEDVVGGGIILSVTR